MRISFEENDFPVSGFPVEGPPSGAIVPPDDPMDLAAGVYWQSGLVTAPPTESQGWIAGLPGLSSGASVSILRVVVSAAKTGCSTTATYKGLVAESPFYWTGVAYATLTGLSQLPWPPHAGYTQDTNAGTTWDSQASSAWLIQLTEDDTSGGFIQADAFTVS